MLSVEPRVTRNPQRLSSKWFELTVVRDVSTNDTPASKFPLAWLPVASFRIKSVGKKNTHTHTNTQQHAKMRFYEILDLSSFSSFSSVSHRTKEHVMPEKNKTKPKQNKNESITKNEEKRAKAQNKQNQAETKKEKKGKSTHSLL